MRSEYQSGKSALKSETPAIPILQPTNTLKKLRSSPGSVHNISNFNPNIAQLCHHL